MDHHAFLSWTRVRSSRPSFRTELASAPLSCTSLTSGLHAKMARPSAAEGCGGASFRSPSPWSRVVT
eukprot:6385920-Pyramimonas_sp.AAC.1